jgi:hypothetical protein
LPDRLVILLKSASFTCLLLRMYPFFEESVFIEGEKGLTSRER